MLANIIRYNKIKQHIEMEFKGLPYLHRVLVCFLLNNVNLDSGIVEDISYYTIGEYLDVRIAPGRKNTGTPSKQTIRNAIATIARECGKHFKIITEGQNLKFQFPQLPKLLSEALANTEVNTDSNIATAQSRQGLEDDFEVKTNTEADTLLNGEPVFSNPVKNKNINNKQTKNKPLSESRGVIKTPVPDEFYPNSRTIQIARSLGFEQVENPVEIESFIAYNKQQQTRWADFNPVYLRWLERKSNNNSERSITIKRSPQHERRCNQNASGESIQDVVARKNQNAIAPDGKPYKADYPANRDREASDYESLFGAKAQQQSFELALAAINEDLWGAFHQQTRASGQWHLA